MLLNQRLIEIENMSNDKVQLFDESAGAMALAQNDAGAVARATQEIQAALVIAQRFPRDEVKLLGKILTACKRVELAEVSEYEYNRGGTRITGPTIDLLRAIASRWGNIRHGWTETERGNGISSVRAFAWDMQTNTQAERTFKVTHKRDTRDGSYELKDERDIYELLANAAARRVRACLEEVIDSDVVIAAVDQCRATLKAGAGNEHLKDRAVKMVAAFQEFAVTQEMIEARLGNKLDAVSENQIASLKRIFKSLRDGVGTREDYFKPATSSPDFAPKSADTKAQALAKLQAAAQAAAETREKLAGDPPGSQAIYPEPSAPAPEPETKSAYNPLKALRNLLKMGGIKETEMLEYWVATGATDGSHSSLEEVMIGLPTVVESTAAQFTPVAAKIKEMRGGK